ncbi:MULTISPECIES: ABC transporter permease subunit [Microbacterium]|uniref:ABC transporter permease n=1 Tax=Microbacterium TaxID=33882 RepID=UPI001EF5C077|nr:ABC transporter permease subunit [Microbacterium sp. KCTC 39802]
MPVGDAFEAFFDWLNVTFGPAFDAFSDFMGAILDGFIAVLSAPDPVILALIFGLIALVTRGWKFAVLGFLGLVLIIAMGQWYAAMQTLALVLVAAAVAVLISVPLGILAARSKTASSILRPILDFMQTMPGFVWLVPVVTLFGIGIVPGVIATIIFALPPGVRLTELGLRSVDGEVVEAAEAFGATPRQTLLGVQLPLATPAIMAGVNQVIMMALSMAVIAGLVGAGGLGGQVTSAIATLNVGLGFEAGLSVVILAIYLDRVTASFGAGTSISRAKFWHRKTRPAVEEPAPLDATITAEIAHEKVGG